MSNEGNGSTVVAGGEMLSKKKRSRGAYKGHLSKLEKDISIFLNNFDQGNLFHISKLKSYKTNILEQNESVKKLNDEILEIIPDEDFENEMNQNLLFNDKIHDIILRIDTTLSLPTSHAAINSDSDTVISATSSATSFQVQANLPKIEIPKFYGKPIEWQSFWDQFSAAVDSKTNIPDVVKFSYLKSALSKEVLESIALSNLN
mgnify:CR=1 FL=1